MASMSPVITKVSGLPSSSPVRTVVSRQHTKEHTRGGAGNLTPPASHNASEAAQANKDGRSMRVGVIRCVAAALACGPPLKNGYPLDSGGTIGPGGVGRMKKDLGSAARFAKSFATAGACRDYLIQAES